MDWSDIPGWFTWRDAQVEAVAHFPDGSRFVEVGLFLGRSICSLGEIVRNNARDITLIGVDTCLGSGPEGPRQKDYHGTAVSEGGGTLAGALHRHVIACGLADTITIVIAASVPAAALFPPGSLDWVHLDARHDVESVRADIAAWAPRIRSGGWLSGDDYDAEKWPDVVAAVAASLPDALPWSTGQWRWIAP
ncbi:MAG: class I SAM-dependent methyltransferase [Vicinamibacterales bacterium]